MPSTPLFTSLTFILNIHDKYLLRITCRIFLMNICYEYLWIKGVVNIVYFFQQNTFSENRSKYWEVNSHALSKLYTTTSTPESQRPMSTTSISMHLAYSDNSYSILYSHVSCTLGYTLPFHIQLLCTCLLSWHFVVHTHQYSISVGDERWELTRMLL